MLRLYGCSITPEDAERLVSALQANGSHGSLEAAAVIRWGVSENLSTDELEPGLRVAILEVLDDPAVPPGLDCLRRALLLEGGSKSTRARITRRFHNPKRRDCGCLSDCWCKRTAWGRALRWYVPARLHTSVSPCWECARD